METIHTRIKALRKNKDLSMGALAKLVGVEWQSIQNWENGNSAPKRTRLEKVAHALETTPEYLMTGQEQTQLISRQSVEEPRSTYDINKNIIPIPKSNSSEVAEILQLIEAMSEKGHVMLLTHARSVVKEYPKAKANRAK